MRAEKIWNAMEVAGDARENCNTEIHYSSLTVDHTLALHQMKPRIVCYFPENLIFNLFIEKSGGFRSCGGLSGFLKL